MRPLRLCISAFGSYDKEQVIDFEGFGESGLYLITGDTGSGKTTIFDAVCYCLYGDLSAALRDSAQVRCKYCEPDALTFVELRFLYRGDIYTIRRIPEYERPVKRGNAYNDDGTLRTTIQHAEALLILPDGKEVSGIARVNKYIEELIGLSRQQFLQTAMLAQGDFSRLLVSGSTDKTQLLRSVFHTEQYNEIIERLKEEAQRAKDEFENVREQIARNVSHIRLITEGNLNDELLKMQDAGALVNEDEALVLLKKIIVTEENEVSSIDADDEKKEAIEKKLTADAALAQSILEEFEREKECREELAKSAHELQIAESRLREFENPEYRKQVDAQKEEYMREKALESVYGELDRANLRLKEEYALAINIKKSIDLKQIRLGEAIINIKKLRENETKISEASKKLRQSGSELEKTRISLKAVGDLKKDAEIIILKINDFSDASNGYSKIRGEYYALLEKYAKLEGAYFDKSAGMLASQLKTGSPCPVCGSLDHPSPAFFCGDAPDRQKMEIEKEALENKRKQTEYAAEKRAESQGALQEAMKSYLNDKDNIKEMNILVNEKLSSDVLNDYAKGKDIEKLIIYLKNELEILGAEWEEKKKHSEELEKEVSECRELVSHEDDIKKNITLCEDEKISLEKDIAEYEKKKSACEARIQEQKNASCSLSKRLRYKSREESLRAVEAVKKKIEDDERRYELLKNNYNEIKEKTALSKNIYEELVKKLKGMEKPDKSAIDKRLEEIKTERKQLKKIRDRSFGILDGNRRTLEELSILATDAKKKQEYYTQVAELYETASGRTDQRLNIETFVQQEAFENILYRANIRLREMTGGRYEMLRSDERNGNARLGLDIKVNDNYNATERSIRLLSGGELFKAALSLALGMSEEVRERAGGVCIDTLFVDEGFGSLDKESLDLSIQVLQRLSGENRLIGIISHVDELKTMIKNKIIVEKDLRGCSRCRVETE